MQLPDLHVSVFVKRCKWRLYVMFTFVHLTF